MLSPAGQDRADDGMTEQLMGAVDREDPDRRGAVEPVVPEHRKSRCEGDEEARAKQNAEIRRIAEALRQN